MGVGDCGLCGGEAGVRGWVAGISGGRSPGVRGGGGFGAGGLGVGGCGAGGWEGEEAGLPQLDHILQAAEDAEEGGENCFDN